MVALTGLRARARKRLPWTPSFRSQYSAAWLELAQYSTVSPMNMNRHATLTRCCIAVLLIISTLTARGDTFRPFNAANPANPYGLENIDGFNLGDYEYCRWGVFQSDDHVSIGEADLTFTHLTRGPFTFADNPDLFVSTSLTTLADANLLQFSTGTWTPPSGLGDGAVSFSALPGKTYSLFRKLHFRDYLKSKFSFSDPLPPDAKKVIVLIHGWNPDSHSYHYSAEFDALYEALKAEISGTEWHLVLYRWEEDADTGGILAPFMNATEAATIAHFHGQHLGELLSSFPQVEKVHFIAHSAGTWAARAATRHLLERTTTKTQITLLDPFVPGEITGHATPFTRAEIEGIPALAIGQTGQLFYIENIYAIDLDDTEGWPASSDNIHYATSAFFSWSGLKNWNQRVDWTPGGTAVYAKAAFYDFHAGPIGFYADTVLKFGSRNLPAAGLGNSEFKLDLVGWKKSMFYREPVVSPRAPLVQEAASGGKTLSGIAHLRGNTAATAGIQYRWEVATSGATGPWQPFNGVAFGSSPILSLSSADVSVGRRWFRLVAETDAGFDTGNAVQIGSDIQPPNPTPTAPAAPSNLVATAVSASQINLRWTDGSNNESGFKLQRRPSSTNTWTDISTTVAANGTAFSNITGLSAATTYFYRVAAFNSTGTSAWSSEASATTSAPASTNYTVQVDAVDLAASQNLTATVASWTGQGDNYQSKATGFFRTFTGGTRVTLSAPTTLPGGKNFHYWQIAANTTGVTNVYSTLASFDMTANHGAIAVYGTAPAPALTPSSLAIEGPSSLDEDSSASYKARVTYSDGSSAYVSAVWDENSSYADISSSGRLDAESVSSSKTVEIEASYTAGGVTVEDTKDVTIRNAVSTQTYTLTRHVVGSGEIGYSPHASSYTAGTVVSLHGNEGDGYVFSHWSGDASGSDDDTTVRMDRDRTVTAHFVVDTSEGSINVHISPPQAGTEGAAWKYHNFTAWRPSGDDMTGLSPRTGKYVNFKDIPGWIAPDSVKADIIGGETTVVSGAAATYREILGNVQVTISPPEAAGAGARWRIDGGPWQQSSVSIPNVSTGEHALEFLAIPNWTSPANQTITVARGLPTIANGSYGPPAGLPLITSITPNAGSIEGGIEVTIEGASFVAGATVSFGSVAATNVVVQSDTRLTALLPARATYGTVDVTVNSGGQQATRLAGFTYDIPLGVNMTLLGQLGGSVQAVAAQGNLVVFGEGSSIVAADYTNPAAPVIRGRLALPGMVRDIRIDGNLALVANHHFGLQIVDISNPAALRKVGFYDTPGAAVRLGLHGKRAYVAEQGNADVNGLIVIDYTNAASPAKVLSYGIAGTVMDIGLTPIGSRQIACVATQYAGVAVIDVTDLNNLRTVSIIEAGVYNPKIAVGGNFAFVTAAINGDPSSATGAVYDLSIPEDPVKRKDSLEAAGFHFSQINIPYLYVGDDMLRIYDLSDPNVPRRSSLSLEGDTAGMALSNGVLFMANSDDGLMAVNVGSVSSPSIVSTLNTTFEADDVIIANDIAYVSLGGGLTGPVHPVVTAIDVASRTAPRRLGSATFTSSVGGILRAGGFIYGFTQQRGVAAFNFQNPSAPTQISARATDRATFDGAILGQNLLLGGYTEGGGLNYPLISLYDGTNPSNAVPLSSLQISANTGLVTAVTGFGSHVFAFTSRDELKVIDVGNPSSPAVIATLSVSGYPLSIAMSADGNYLFAANTSDGLSIYDCSTRTAPRLLTAYARNDFRSGRAVTVRDSLVFYADNRGLNVLDCSDIANPVLVASYDTPGLPEAVFVEGSDVFVADGAAGLEILRLGDVSRPNIEITAPTRNSSLEVTEGVLALGGIASDAQSVNRVTWNNNRGGSGVATGTTFWSTVDVRLSPGVNVLTVTAEDAQGNLARDSITVTATLPETDGPAILITGPKPPPAFTFTTDTLPLTGTAADVSGVQSVAWTNDRSGSGVATGTTAWSADIPLFDGPNRITITALDTVGNGSQTDVLVTHVPPDATAPTVGITFPTDAQEAATTEPQLNLAGDADDDRAVARVTWANSRGGSGEAIGGKVWHTNGIVLQPGVNVLAVSVEDAAGNIGTDTLVVTFAPIGSDPARPVLAVQTPGTKPLATEQNHIACAGQASGGSAITEVVVQVNTGPWLGVTGTANWTADVALTPGRNLIRFKAIDVTGRESLTVERVVTYRKLAPLALTTQGEGTATLVGNLAVASLEVGKLYTANAKPAKGWVFAGWSGIIVSNSRRVAFVMEEGAAFEAVFVENPYADIAATYRGLVRSEPLTHAANGTAAVTLAKSGAFTAKFIIGGKPLGLKGAFDGTGSFLGRLKGNGAQTYNVLLTLDTATQDAPVTGLLSDGTTTLALNAWPTTKFDPIAGAPQAGGYTVAVEPGTTAGFPIGYGTGRMTVGKTGSVKIASRLANGARIAFASAITSGNRVPVYAAMNNGRSSFSAPIAFADKPDSDSDGIAFWSSARVRSATYPFEPFAFDPRILAQRYTPPATGERSLLSLDATNGAATTTLDDGTTPLTQPITLGTDNKLTLGNPLLNGFKMTLFPKTGEFSGSLLLPANGKRVLFNGVLLEKSGEGVGLLLSPAGENAVTLEPTTP